MATNHTANYQLPKWEKTDRVQMKDFNDMTATLDEALHGLAVSAEAAQAAVDSEAAARAAAITALENKSRFTKLKEVNIAQQTNSFTISLTDIDWSKWDKIHLDYYATNGSKAFLKINSADGSSLLSLEADNSGKWAPRFTMEIHYRPERELVLQNGAYRSVVDGVTYSSLQRLVYTGSTMYPNAKFILWGEA